jgi:O-antigen/teichoic acid export membrane protein
MLFKLGRVIGIAILRFGTIGLSLAFSVVAARTLGTADFGRFVSIWAVTGLFVVATGAGLPQLIEREVAAARGSASIERLIPLIHGVSLLLCLGSVAATLTLLFFGSSVQIAAMFVIVGLLVTLMGAVLVGYEFVTTIAWVETFVRPAAALAALAGIALIAPLSVEWTLAAQLLGIIVAGISFFLTLRSVDLSLLRRAWNFSWEDLHLTPEHNLIAKAGFHFAMIQLLINAAQQTEILWLTALAPPEVVAHFFAATRAANAVSFFHASVNALYYPTIVRLNAEGRAAERDLEIKRATRISLGLTCLAALGAALISGPYLRAFGTGFIEAQKAMYVLLLGWVVIGACGPIISILQMRHRESVVTSSMVLGLALGSLAALLLIPRFGLLGAASSAIVTNVTPYILMLCFTRKAYIMRRSNVLSEKLIRVGTSLSSTDR